MLFVGSCQEELTAAGDFKRCAKNMSVKTKFLLFGFPLLFLSSCKESNDSSSITKEGVAEFIHFSTGPTSSTLLAHEEYDGKSGGKATYTSKWRNPTIKLSNSYIEISYPGTDHADQVIPRESLIEMQWKTDDAKR